MNIELKSLYLLMACLNLMQQPTRERFEQLLKTRRMDRALHELLTNGVFPQWFRKNFFFDPLHGTLSGLREYLSAATANELVRMDGTNFAYHLELSPRLIAHLMCDVPLANDEIRKISKQLESLLN